MTKGLDLLADGSAQLEMALQIVKSRGPVEEAAKAIDIAVPLLRSAMNWLEDTDSFEIAHERLDQAGMLRRHHFAQHCLLAMDEHGYAIVCPVALAHNRVGLSPGYIVRAAQCSVCHQDPEDCEHIVGRTYGGVICHRRLTRIDVLEVSLVGRPAQPDARIARVSISDAELREQLGSGFHPGIRVVCDRCLSPCEGVSRPFEGGTHVLLA